MKIKFVNVNGDPKLAEISSFCNDLRRKSVITNFDMVSLMVGDKMKELGLSYTIKNHDKKFIVIELEKFIYIIGDEIDSSTFDSIQDVIKQSGKPSQSFLNRVTGGIMFL